MPQNPISPDSRVADLRAADLRWGIQASNDMIQWADKVFDIIERDLASQPLATLRPLAETQGVLKFVRTARDTGHSCVFIAHNIHHVFQVVDRIAVMRLGTVVADDIDPRRTSVEEVERIITGMEVA